MKKSPNGDLLNSQKRIPVEISGPFGASVPVQYLVGNVKCSSHQKVKRAFWDYSGLRPS